MVANTHSSCLLCSYSWARTRKVDIELSMTMYISEDIYPVSYPVRVARHFLKAIVLYYYFDIRLLRFILSEKEG